MHRVSGVGGDAKGLRIWRTQIIGEDIKGSQGNIGNRGKVQGG